MRRHSLMRPKGMCPHNASSAPPPKVIPKLPAPCVLMQECVCVGVCVCARMCVCARAHVCVSVSVCV